jgi:hypothetical protein
MHRFVVVAALVAALTGCAPTVPVALLDLKDEYVAYGGTCASWSTLTEPRAIAAIECDGGGKIYLFDSDASRADVVKTELEVNQDIRARTHIMLSGNTWLVVDRIGVIVMLLPKMGGMIQGRNGANP